MIPTRSLSVSIVSALLLTACADETQAARKVVLEQLADPSSAKFENVVVKRQVIEGDTFRPARDSEIATCGWVNSKNGFGAYVGSRRFIVKQGVPTFGDATDADWNGEFSDCVAYSQNTAANQRLAREIQRDFRGAMDAIGGKGS